MRRSERSRNCSAPLLAPSSNWGQITPGRQICWIYHLDLLDLPSAFVRCIVPCMHLSDEKSVSKKMKTSSIKAESRPQASPLMNVGHCIKADDQNMHPVISQEVKVFKVFKLDTWSFHGKISYISLMRLHLLS